MPNDRIIEPSDVSGIIREWLSGSITDAQACYSAYRLAGNTDRVLAGHQTPAVVASCWALRRLAESGPGRPDRERMSYLLDCIEGRERFRRDREPL
jgi:hypothetical protein